MTAAEEKRLATELAAFRAQTKVVSDQHTAGLHKLNESLQLTNVEIVNIGTELAVVQSRCANRGKRISTEAVRVTELEGRIRRQEDTGVHHVGELAGRKAVKKGVLFSFAVLGAIGTVSAIVFGVIKLTGCS